MEKIGKKKQCLALKNPWKMLMTTVQSLRIGGKGNQLKQTSLRMMVMVIT